MTRTIGYALVALFASGRPPPDRRRSARSAPEDAVRRSSTRSRPGTRRAAGVLRSRRAELARLIRDRSYEPPGVHGHIQNSGTSRMRRRVEDARHRQQLALPVPLVKGRRIAIRHSRRQKKCWRGGSDATSWKRSRPPVPTSPRSSVTRNRDTRQARGRARDEVEERSRQGERPVLADRARPEAVHWVTWWHRQRRGRPIGTDAAAHGLSWLLFPDLTDRELRRQAAPDYVVKGEMSGGFALVAWPTQCDATGVMTFIVNQDGTVREQDRALKPTPSRER
jgi:hypothetical protein